MKVKPKLKSPVYELAVAGCDRPFWIDSALAAKITQHDWRYVPKMKRARATIRSGEPRVFLHRYIVRLLKLRWPEVFFANDDPFDCRKRNLRPYLREEQGAKRKLFKGKKVPFKGVTLRADGKFQAAIRVNRKLKHLGYFPTARMASSAYLKAFREAHPNLTLNV